MAREDSNLLHLRVLPDYDLVLRVAMSTDELVGGLRPGEVTDLRTRVDGADSLAGQGVPESDATIGGTTTTREDTALQRRPSDGLDGSNVVREAKHRVFVKPVPNKELVVVAARCKLRLFRVPLEPANFLLVTGKLADKVAGDTDVAVVDRAIAGARRQNVVQRGHGPDTSVVVVELANLFLAHNVPDLNGSFGSSDGNVVALKRGVTDVSVVTLKAKYPGSG